MSSSSVVSLSSFNLLFFTQVLTVLTSSIKYNEYVTDKGKNISIPCSADGTIMWVKENENSNSSTIIQTGKFLVLTNVSASDRGLYVCFASVAPVTRLVTPTAASKPPTSPSPNPTSSPADDEATTISRSSSNMSSTVVAVDTATETSKVDLAAEPAMVATSATAPTTSTPPMKTESTVAATLPPPSVRVIIENATGDERNVSSTFAVDIVAAAAGAPLDDIEEYVAVEKFHLTVRTPPGPVTQLYFKASTILGFLIWRVNKTNNGGYPLRSFTAEYRNVSRPGEPYVEHAWSRMDPVNIAPNVRQMEVYHLEPNSTYEFRIWANNVLGSGDIVTTNVTTLPETKEEDLIRLIQPDLDNFDPRIWIVAVSVVLGTLVILAIGLCIVLSKECYQSSHMAVDDGWDSIELIPNIILNPGFCEADGSQQQPFTRTIIFGEDDASDSYESESDHEPRMEKFKRKVSVFFQGPMIHRI